MFVSLSLLDLAIQESNYWIWQSKRAIIGFGRLGWIWQRCAGLPNPAYIN
jgi:hypothetical protein